MRSILSTRNPNCNTFQDDPFLDPDTMDNPDHITFCPITLKVIDGFTSSICSLAQGTPYILRILRSIDKYKYANA